MRHTIVCDAHYAQDAQVGRKTTNPSPARPERGSEEARSAYLRLRAVRARSPASRITLRMRTLLGVTSTHSSSRQNSRHCSSESFFGGMTFSKLSEVAERMLVCCFSLVMLTSMSSAREFSPTIMPSYTSVVGSTNMTPRSCSEVMAYAVAAPLRSATSEPLLRLRISPAHGS